MGYHEPDGAPGTQAVEGASNVSRRLRRSSRVLLVLMCATQFMVTLDVSVLNVALPSIQEALRFGTNLHWIVNAYTLVNAGFLLIAGRFADIYGRKRIFVAGLVLFSAASLVGGLATTASTLIAARAAQGLGAAVLVPATLTILTTTFLEGSERARALGTWTAAGVGGGAAGNLIGGLLTQFLSWRSILLINVPIGALAIVLAIRFLKAHQQQTSEQRLDIPGAVLATLGFASLTYGIAQTRTHGWDDSLTVVPLFVGLVALAVFVLVETRFTHAPLIPLHLFRLRSISLGNIVMLLAGASFVPCWYFFALFMSNVMHYKVLQIGLGFLPFTLLTIVVGARVGPWFMDRFEGRVLISMGALIGGIGFWWQGQADSGVDYVPGVLGPMMLIAIGGGLLNTPITATVTSGISQADAGAASGLVNTARQMGGALGLAGLVAIAGNPLVIPEGFAGSYGRAFSTIALLLLVVSVLSLALPRGTSGAK